MWSVIRNACLAVAGLIHLLPVTGILGSDRLQMLYGLEITDPNLLIMMQHRAVLFGILGLLLIVAIGRPELRITAIVAGLISACSFLAIALMVGGYNAFVHRVVVADIVAVLCLFTAGGTLIAERSR